MVMAPGSGQIGLRASRAHPRTLASLQSLVRCSELAKARQNKVCPSCPPPLFFPLLSSFLVTELKLVSGGGVDERDARQNRAFLACGQYVVLLWELAVNTGTKSLCLIDHHCPQ